MSHIPGVLNVEADKESRYFQEAAEWGWQQELVDEIEGRWGLPQIDFLLPIGMLSCKDMHHGDRTQMLRS